VDQEIANRRSQINLCRRCSAYSDDAVNMAYQNQMVLNSCGYEGAAWTTDRAGHFQWCMAAKSEFVDEEAATRKQKIDMCTSCRSYAKNAVIQARKYQYTCYTDPPHEPRWSDYEQSHFSWCMGLRNYASAYYEGEARQAALDACERTNEANIRRNMQGLTVAKPSGSELSPTLTRPNANIKATPKRRTGKNSESVSIAKPKSDAPCGASGKPCNRARLLGPGLLEGDGGFSQQGPAEVGRPGGGSAPSGNSIRLR